MKKRALLIFGIIFFVFQVKGVFGGTCYDYGSIYTSNAYCYDDSGWHYNSCYGSSSVKDWYCDYYPYLHCNYLISNCPSGYSCKNNICEKNPTPTPTCVCYYNGMNHECGPDSCGTGSCGRCTPPAYCGYDSSTNEVRCISPCTSHDTYKCYNNDVYWYDSCGNREEKKQECGSAGCYNSNCCTSHYTYKCYNNDVYWYSSCNRRQGKKQECYSAGCSGNACLTCSDLCNSFDTYRCSNSNFNLPVEEYGTCYYNWAYKGTTSDCNGQKCWCANTDTNKECSSSICTNSGWDNSPCCIPDCTNKECGDDGCGGSCGDCSNPDEGCINNKCVQLCSVQCQGHSYLCSSFDYSSSNPFESGSSCYYNWENKGNTPDCASNQYCWCYDKETCTPPETCSSPTEGCVCVPNCTNKECGDDGCGGSCGSCNANEFCNTTIWKCQPLKKDDGEPCTSNTECNSDYCSNGYCCNAGECCSSNNDCQDNEYCSLNHNCTLCPENSCGASAVDSSFVCNANEYGVFNHTKHCSLKCFNENKSKEACEICNGKAYVTAKFHSKVFDEIQKRIGMGMMSPIILTQSVCCPNATYCVFNGKCYPLGTKKDVDMNGKVEICGS